VRAASASRRGGTPESVSSRIACIARSSDTSAARTFSATASRAGGSASSRKWCRAGLRSSHPLRSARRAQSQPPQGVLP
jgi:hypothetical protein